MFAWLKTPLTIYFMHLGNKEIYWIFKACCIINLFYFQQNSIYLILYLLMLKEYDFQKPCTKISTPTPVFCYCLHHASSFMALFCPKICINFNKMWPTPAGWRLILSQQCWILPSDLSSLPSMPIHRHSTSDTARYMSSSTTLIIYTVFYVSKQLS